jgi:hypothetical protein
MTLILTILFFVAGGICLTKPKRLVEWMTMLAARMQGKDATSFRAMENQGLLLFIRVIGILALVNAVMLLFITSVAVDSN